jgi:hypothetical protein
MDAAQFQLLIDGVVNALRPAQAAAVPFAVNPAGGGNAAWDFTTGSGLKIFLASTAAFDVLFDGDQASLTSFLSKIWLRAESFGWTTNLLVNDDDAAHRSLTREHGCLNLANMRAAAIPSYPPRQHKAAPGIRNAPQAHFKLTHSQNGRKALST